MESHIRRRLSREQKEYVLQARKTRTQRPFIFGVGVTSTGQTSLTMALELLGFRTHQGGYGEASWRYVFENDQSLIENVGARTDAWTDWPAFIMGDLREACPGNLWIATVRDDVQSWCQTAFRRFYVRQEKINRDGVTLKHCADMELRRRLYGRMLPDKHQMISGYRDHVKCIKQLEEDGERVCWIDTAESDKWAVLCKFLDLPRPPFEYPWIRPAPGGRAWKKCYLCSSFRDPPP
jgi:hypothetical protein